jgi:gamma-glutamyltranspeptidase/glutathione hydrolase
MGDGGCVTLEGSIPASVRDQLAARGHKFCLDRPVGGRYLGILRDGTNGVYWGAIESRDYGQAAGY